VSQLAGEFVFGDSAKPLYYYVRRNGVALDVSQASNISLKMVRKSSGSDATVTVSGSPAVSIVDTSAFEFSGAVGTSVGFSVPLPTSRLAPDIYECRISFFLGGVTYWTDPFRIAVVKFP